MFLQGVLSQSFTKHPKMSSLSSDYFQIRKFWDKRGLRLYEKGDLSDTGFFFCPDIRSFPVADPVYWKDTCVAGISFINTSGSRISHGRRQPQRGALTSYYLA